MAKILIISNESLSNESSNGRTILHLLSKYDPNLIAQFSIHGKKDKKVVDKIYQISDGDALNAFIKCKVLTSPNSMCDKSLDNKKIPHTCRNMAIRNIIWMSYKWWDKKFDDFITDFSPDVLLLQAGDSPFMFAITYRIRKRWKIPIIIYNSESYVLKKRIYSSAKRYSPWHLILMGSLRHWYKKIMKVCSYCIYSMEELENAYQATYPHPGKSKTIYTSSSILRAPATKKNSKPFTLAYCGNLGVGRSDCLIELADTLYKINNNARLIICGKFPSADVKNEVCKNPAVDYRGFVSYEETQEILRSSSMVIHCEKADRLVNLKYAFSTKIADSLACGIPFVVYASREYPFVHYLEKNNAAHIAGDINELSEILRRCISDNVYLNSTLDNALLLAKRNHDIELNANMFKDIIQQVQKAAL